jgi:protein-S-isoprenylcysteine O-methyltransferase Ste14
VSKTAGGCLIAAGILIAGVSGICSLVFVEEVFTNSAMIWPIIRLGVVPFCLGIGMFFWGRSIMRKADAAAPPPTLNKEREP